MVEKDTISSAKISYTGLGDFKAAYKHGHEWLASRGWKVSEEKYSEKVTGEAKEIEFKWSCSRTLTDYFKGKVTLDWKLDNLKDVQVEIDGRRQSMQQFKIEIKIKGVLEKDYKSKWTGTNTHKWMKEVYHKYVIPQRVSEKEGAVGDTVTGFKEEMKAFFDLTGRA